MDSFNRERKTPMKKKLKKLALNRETVRTLADGAMSGIAGGTTQGFTYQPERCGTSCQCFDHPNTFSEYCTEECPPC